MGTRLRGACDAFEVTVDEPARGDRELRVEVVFAPGGPTDRATIELRLYARRRRAPLRGERRWDTEASVPRTKARLERGETGRLRFALPIPAFVAPFGGEWLEFGVVLVTEGEDGSRVSLLLDAPPVAEDARLVVRGTPLERELSPRGLAGRLRARGLLARLEQSRAGAVSVTVAGRAPLAAGRVRLEAVEHEFSEGSDREWHQPIVASEARLAPAGDGRLRGELELPAATAAPASIECRLEGHRRQGVRWVARFEVEDERGRGARADAVLHVGVERDPPAAGNG